MMVTLILVASRRPPALTLKQIYFDAYKPPISIPHPSHKGHPRLLPTKIFKGSTWSGEAGIRDIKETESFRAIF